MSADKLLPDELLPQIIDGGYCPDCHSEAGFLAGPEGGLMTNIKCKACGVKFNYCPSCAVIPAGLAQRI